MLDKAGVVGGLGTKCETSCFSSRCQPPTSLQTPTLYNSTSLYLGRDPNAALVPPMVKLRARSRLQRHRHPGRREETADPSWTGRPPPSLITGAENLPSTCSNVSRLVNLVSALGNARKIMVHSPGFAPNSVVPAIEGYGGNWTLWQDDPTTNPDDLRGEEGCCMRCR